MSERLYFQYQPTEDALLQLTKLQDSLAEQQPVAQPVSPNEMHMTLLPFGKIGEVYDELRRYAPTLEPEAYSAGVAALTDEMQAVLPATVRARHIAYGRFGPKNDTLVLRLQPENRLRGAHDFAIRALKRQLTNWGITSPDEYMKQSSNFRNAVQFRPHITMLKQISAHSEKQLLKDILHLELVPPDYDMKHGRYT